MELFLALLWFFRDQHGREHKLFVLEGEKNSITGNISPQFP
jgi:hypothetical protein